MIELSFPVSVRIENSVVNNPIFTGFWIYLQTVDNANTFDDSMCLAAVLTPHQFDLVGEVLVEHRVIEYKIPRSRKHYL